MSRPTLLMVAAVLLLAWTVGTLLGVWLGAQ